MSHQHDGHGDTMTNATDAEMGALLKTAKRIAVVGLSDKPDRDSYRVADYLLRYGYEIIPVNPAVTEVLGVKSAKSLAEIEGHIDIVDVFRKSDAVPAIAKEAVRLGAGALWLQLGVEHEEAAAEAKAAGLVVVQDHCIKIEHARLTR